MEVIICFFISIIATTLGAVSGLGGGVIIKPALDMFGFYDINSISLLSGITVFVMSIVSIGKNIKKGVEVDLKRTIFLSVGAIAGGLLGGRLFNLFLITVNNPIKAQKIQSVLLFIMMFVSLVLYANEDKIKKLNIKSNLACIVIGCFLGIISSFLGIGGGPLNVIVLMYLLGMDAKESAINSLITIFFSQGSKLMGTLMKGSIGSYNLEAILLMLIGGIAGGMLGPSISSKIDKSKVKSIFIFTMYIVMGLNVVNIIR